MSPFLCDPTRLSRILKMCFLAAAESELSHFTEPRLKVCVLSKHIKQACEPCTNISIFFNKEHYAELISRTRQPSYLCFGEEVVDWIRCALKGGSGVNPKMVHNGLWLKVQASCLLPENTLRWGVLKFWGLGSWCGSWPLWQWKYSTKKDCVSLVVSSPD